MSNFKHFHRPLYVQQIHFILVWNLFLNGALFLETMNVASQSINCKFSWFFFFFRISCSFFSSMIFSKHFIAQWNNANSEWFVEMEDRKKIHHSWNVYVQVQLNKHSWKMESIIIVVAADCTQQECLMKRIEPQRRFVANKNHGKKTIWF